MPNTQFLAAGVGFGCMRASVPSFPSALSGSPISPMLNVMILYEDFGTGLRAKRSLDLLPYQPRADAKLSTKLWRIQLLSDPLLCEQAGMEGAVADVIFLSVHGRNALPAEVEAWLRCWLRHKQRRAYALGVLLDSGAASQGGDNPVVSYMQQVATTAGADLFYGFSEAPVSDLDPAMEEINQRARQSSAVIEDMLKRTAPHRYWGINE